MVNGELVPIVLGLAALGGVILQYVQWRKGRSDRTAQLRILARQVSPLEKMVGTQGKVVSALAESQKGKSEVWREEVERRKKKDEFEKGLQMWNQLRNLLDI